jgi:hypothetical protein
MTLIGREDDAYRWHTSRWQLCNEATLFSQVRGRAMAAFGTNATLGPRRSMSAVGSRTDSTRTSPLGRPQADPATDRQNPPRAILAQLEVAHRLPGAPMERSIPRGANIGPSSCRTGDSRQLQSRRYVISRDGTGRLASHPDKNLLTGRPVGFLELYSLLSGSTHFVTR